MALRGGTGVGLRRRATAFSWKEKEGRKELGGRVWTTVWYASCVSFAVDALVVAKWSLISEVTAKVSKSADAQGKYLLRTSRQYYNSINTLSAYTVR